MAKENEIVIFETSDYSISLPVTLDSDTVWLNRTQMAELFGRDIKTIGKHIKNALHEELDKDSSVVTKFATTADTRNITISSACLVWHLCYHKSRGNHPEKCPFWTPALKRDRGDFIFSYNYGLHS